MVNSLELARAKGKIMAQLTKPEVNLLVDEVFGDEALEKKARDIFGKGETDENKVKTNQFFEAVKRALPPPYTGDTRAAGKVILEYTRRLISEKNS